MSSRRGDGRYAEEDIVFRRSRAPPEVIDREEIRIREDTRMPAYVREELARPVVLRAREREEFEYRPRRKSPSPERKVERESITIRRDRSESRPPGDRDRDREQIIIRREEDDDDTRSRRSYTRPRDYDREEVIIRRDEADIRSPRRSDYALVRPKSRERERSTARHSRAGSDSEHEIIIRRNEREGRGGERSQEEIVIRHRSRSRSSSPARSVRASDPQIINAPQIHQEVITHHRHIDHGYQVAIPTRRPVSRPPSPPSPPREKSEERISIHRSGERNGRSYHEDVVIDRNDGGRSAPPREMHDRLPPLQGHIPSRSWRDERDMAEEAAYYNSVAMRRARPGEAWHGATRDWELVDVPPGTDRVRMDGAGGGQQEITWQRYNGVRRSRFYPDGEDDYPTGYEVEPLRPPAPIRSPSPARDSRGELGGRYGRAKDPKEGLWTEITKDLVVKEAIQEMGYEFEETDDFYYVIAYLKYEDVARLVGLSEDIRKDRRKRVKEIEWESRVAPEPEIEEPKRIEPPPSRSKSPWNSENDRYIEREIVYRGGRPPPPPGWRR